VAGRTSCRSRRGSTAGCRSGAPGVGATESGRREPAQ
jgi:hypothetical protein